MLTCYKCRKRNVEAITYWTGWIYDMNLKADKGFLYFYFQASGVTVSDVCKTTYEEIKKDKKHRYVIFYIRDEKQIDVETVGDRNSEYDQFLDDIQKCGPGECR